MFAARQDDSFKYQIHILTTKNVKKSFSNLLVKKHLQISIMSFQFCRKMLNLIFSLMIVSFQTYGGNLEQKSVGGLDKSVRGVFETRAK